MTTHSIGETDDFDNYIVNYLVGQQSIKDQALINSKYKNEWIKLQKDLDDLCVRYQEMMHLKEKYGECSTPDGILWGLRHGGERLLIYLKKLESEPDFLLLDT